jgi:Gpi18-like mannosyltransferase
LVRFAFFSNQGYQIDTGDFRIWFQTAADHGPRVFYLKTWSDYPPFNIYFFWLFGLLAKNLSLFGSSLFTYIMKLPPNLFDMATAFVIFAFVRKRLTFKIALLAATLYAFNPAVIFNAAVWGQFDAIYTFFLVLSLYLIFESKPKWAVVAFMIGVLTKPQSVAIAPLMIFLVFRKYNWNWKKLLMPFLVAAATVFAVILTFEWSNPVTFLYNIYVSAYSTPNYQVTSLNAFNIWGLGGMWISDTQGFFFITANLIGWLMFGLFTAFTLYFVHKRISANEELTVLFAAFVLFFGFFMLPTRIHERYLFPAISILALMFPFLKKTRFLFLALTATCFVNQAYVLNALVAAYPYGPNLTGDLVAITVSLINLIAFLYVLMLMLRELWGKRWLTPSPNGTQVNASGEGNG